MQTIFNAQIWGDTVRLPALSDRVLYVWLCHNSAVEITGLYVLDYGRLLQQTALPPAEVFQSLALLTSLGWVTVEDSLAFVPRVPSDQHLFTRSTWPAILRNARDRYGSRLTAAGRPNAAVLAWHAWTDQHRPPMPHANAPRRNAQANAIPHAIPHSVGVLTIPTLSTEDDPMHGNTLDPTHDNTLDPTGNTGQPDGVGVTISGVTIPPPIPSPSNSINNSYSDQEGGVEGDRAGGVGVRRAQSAEAEAPVPELYAPGVPVVRFFGGAAATGVPVSENPPTEAHVESVMRAYVARRWGLYPHFAALDVTREAARFVDHYTVTRWMRTRSTPMRDWQQAAVRWLRVWPEHNAAAWTAFQRGRPNTPTQRAAETPTRVHTHTDGPEPHDGATEPHDGATDPHAGATAADIWNAAKQRMGLTDDDEGQTGPPSATNGTTNRQQPTQTEGITHE